MVYATYAGCSVSGGPLQPAQHARTDIAKNLSTLALRPLIRILAAVTTPPDMLLAARCLRATGLTRATTCATASVCVLCVHSRPAGSIVPPRTFLCHETLTPHAGACCDTAVSTPRIVYRVDTTTWGSTAGRRSGTADRLAPRGSFQLHEASAPGTVVYAVGQALVQNSTARATLCTLRRPRVH
jgi:hypothetical protein